MRFLLIILLIALLVVMALVSIVVFRGGRRGYQRYAGLERQRAGAKQSRDSGADRLKLAEQHLVGAQQVLISKNEYAQAQEVERIRRRLSTQSDRLRHATYGYSPLGSPNRIREAELAALQERDSDTMFDAQQIVNLSEIVRRNVVEGQKLDLDPLQLALDALQVSLDRRQATN